MKILKVYGPYSRKQDKRKVVVLRLEDGTLTTRSYAKYLYERENGIIIDPQLTVDHIDEDETNDIISNFQLLTRIENAKKSAKKGSSELYKGICPICKKEFTKYMRDVRGNQNRQNKAGPFCSRKCAGIYGTNVQRNQKELLNLAIIINIEKK